MTAASPEGAVSFYRANERPYGAFSNLYRRPVVVRGRSFPTVEHAYQSRKARKPEVREWILSAPSPSLVAAAAHSLLHWDVAPGWSRLRYPWMMECLRAKYRQHDDLAQLLVGTTTATLVEAGSVDNEVNRRWGVVAGRGRNLLGRMLMLVRAELGGATYADEELLGLLAHAPSLIAEQAGDGRAPAQLLLARLQSATAEDRRTM